MEIEYYLCLTIRPQDEESEEAIKRVHSRLGKRKKGEKGMIFDAETGEAHHTVGGERGMLNRVAGKHVEGMLMSVDQVGTNRVNVAVIVGEEEYRRINKDNEHYEIEAVVPFPRKARKG